MRRGSFVPVPVVVFVAASALLAGAAASSPREAWADGPSRRDELLAQALFDEGRALVERGDFAAACPKLAESQRLDPGGGTLLNLALCHEGEGKLATAYAELGAARAQAVRDGRKDREQLADTHLAALGPKVPRLAVELPSRPLGVELHLDGAPLALAALGVPTMVDPGPHVVEATAPGHAPARVEVKLEPAEQRTVTLPRLVHLAPLAPGGTSPAEAPTAASATRTESNPWHAAAVVTAAFGGVAIGVGGVGWIVSTLQRQSGCVEERSFCDEDGLSALSRERVFGAIALGGAAATVLGLAGVVALPSTVSVRVDPERSGATARVRIAF